MNGKNYRESSAIARQCAEAWKPSLYRRWLGVLSCLGVAAALLWTQPAGAVTITPLSVGRLASGKIVQIVQIIINPGETVPWHYHTATGYVTVISGTLTEDFGCGTPMESYPAGSATVEPAGHVHRLFNFGQEPVVFTGVLVFPGCDPHNGTVFVSGPRCDGNSGNSKKEPIPNCNDNDDESDD